MSNITEIVKYGGIMFAPETPFCGVYSYKNHVSLEFGRGCDLDDRLHVLEGSGKHRRHIKFMAVSDLGTKHVQKYVAQALAHSLELTKLP